MLRRILINPLATLLCFVLLIADLRSLPRHWSESGTSKIARAVLGSGSMRTDVDHAEAYFIQSGTQLTRVFPNDDSWDVMSRALATDPGHSLVLHFSAGTSKGGLWAMTSRHRWYGITADYGSDLSKSDLALARTQFLDSLAPSFTDVDPALWRSLRDQNWSKTTIIWSGYAHNAAALLCLLLLLNSLRWIPRTPAYIRAHRGASRLRRGLCPNCAYSLSDLTTTTCPECGKSARDATVRERSGHQVRIDSP